MWCVNPGLPLSPFSVFFSSTFLAFLLFYSSSSSKNFSPLSVISMSNFFPGIYLRLLNVWGDNLYMGYWGDPERPGGVAAAPEAVHRTHFLHIPGALLWESES